MISGARRSFPPFLCIRILNSLSWPRNKDSLKSPILSKIFFRTQKRKSMSTQLARGRPVLYFAFPTANGQLRTRAMHLPTNEPEKGMFRYSQTRTMLEKYSLTQLKTGIIIFGIIVIVLGSINRLFLDNLAMSVIIVVLIIVFLLVLVWFSIHSRSITFKNVPKRTKHAEEQKFVH